MNKQSFLSNSKKGLQIRNKLISIVVPTKNAARHLKNLLPSLVEQTYKRFELIVNDDKGTTDDTKNLLKQFEKKLTITTLKENISMAQGRKSGANFAKGYYLLHLDSDMVLSPKVLENCIETIEKGYDALLIPEISFGEGFWSQVKIFEKSMHAGDDSIEAVRFFKSNVYKKVGGHNEKMVFSEDKDLDLRVRKAGFKIERSTEPIYHNEGKVSLVKDIQKKYFYGKTAYVFIKENPKQAFIQGNLILRPAYFRNWRKVVSHPILTMGMFVIKALGWLAALLGFLVERSSQLKSMTR